jgi:hypothetical protein
MTYAEVLIRKGKRGAAAYVQAECNSAKSSEPSKSPAHLNALLDHLLHPEKPIDDQDTIDWCRWLVGGGRSYEDFAANGELALGIKRALCIITLQTSKSY